MLLLFLPVGDFAVGLGRLGDPCRVHLALLGGLSWSRLLTVGGLIRRRARRKWSGKAQDARRHEEEEEEEGCCI